MKSANLSTDKETESESEAESDIDSLLDGIDFSTCVERLERRWPKPKVVSPQPMLQRLGRFEIKRELGRGRFGVVFLAWDPQLQRQVALKVPQFDAALDPELRERFRGEALAAGRLQHPGIVALYDVGQHAGVDYLAMAYVEGTTLAERLKAGPLPARAAASLVRDLSSAVHHAHEQGVIHRDLKPSNVLLDLKEHPHVTDFGLARRLTEAALRATASGQVLGTPAYMPPEQATGQGDIGAVSDVYSLGVILYESLTGRPPFQAATFAEAVEFILNRDPLPPSKLNPKLPRELDAIVLKCLEKSTSARYASAAELADDLQRYLDGRPIRAKSLNFVQQGIRWCRKHPSQALLSVATCIAVALLLTTASIYTRWKHASEIAVQQQKSAETERYFASIHRARNMIGRRAPGWSAAALNTVSAAADSRSIVSDPVELRSLAAECLSGFDLQPEADVECGLLIGRIAMSPNGHLLAVGELKGNASCRVLVYDTESKAVRHKFTLTNLESSFTRLWKGEAKWQDGVREFAFSPDSRFLAAGMRFGSVYVFDLSQPEQPPRLLTVSQERELEKIAFSHDSETLFALTKDYQFIRWPAWRTSQKFDSPWPEPQLSFAVAPQANLAMTQDLQRGALRVRDQALRSTREFLPTALLSKGMESHLITDNAGRLLAGDSEHGLCVYDAETGQVLRRLQDDALVDGGFVDDLAMSGDGHLLAAYDDTGVVRVFDVAKGRQVMNLLLGRHELQDVALGPQKRRLVAANDGKLQFWRLSEAKVRRILNHPADPMQDVRFSPAGGQLVCVGNTGSIHGHLRSTLLTFACDTGKLQQRINGGFNRLHFNPDGAQVAWSPDGRELIWSGPFGALHYGQEADGQFRYLRPVPLTGEVFPTEIKATAKKGKPDVTRPASYELRFPKQITTDGHLVVLILSVQVSAAEQFAPPFLYDIQILGEGSTSGAPPPWLLTGKDSPFQQWAVQLPHTKSPWQELTLQIKPAAHLREFQLERADVALLSVTKHDRAFPLTSVVDHLRFGADGQRIWANVDNEVRSWNWPAFDQPTRWSNPHHLLSGAGNVRALQAGREGTLVGTRDGLVHRLSLSKGTSLNVWPGPGKEVTTLAVCDAAELVLAGAENGKVRALAIPDGKTLFELTADEQAIIALAATPDAEWLATASVDRQLKLWRKSSAGFELYCQLPDTSSTARSLQLSVDGRYLAVLGRATAMVELWELQTLQLEWKRLGID